MSWLFYFSIKEEKKGNDHDGMHIVTQLQSSFMSPVYSSLSCYSF